MKFSCEKALLSAAVSTASRAVASKSSIPAMEGILVEAGNQLRLTGYNLETGIQVTVPAEIKDKGSLVLSARLFGEIIRKMPDDMVVFSSDGYMVNIKCGLSEFNILGTDPEEFPELPTVDQVNGLTIPQPVLRSMISQTLFAVSDNESRPIHTGLRFEVENDSISAIAVDGFRLARRTFHPEESTQRELNFVVPAAGLKEVEKIVTDSDEDASFTLGSKHILFQMGSATLVCRLLEGEFLDWRKVVPTNCPIKLVAHVSDLMSSVERVGLIVSEKYKSPVRCTFSNQELMMRTNTTIGAAEDRCSLAGDGKDLEIGFNVRYLADALRVIPSEEVTLELTNGLSPIVLTPVEDKYDFAYMVLPVRIKNG